MGIAGLSERGGSLPQIGIIRKGGKKRQIEKNGRMIEIVGKNLPHFRFDFDPNEKDAIARADQIYGAEPNNLHILLPSPRLEDSWDCWYEAYAGGVMVHRCSRHINGIDPGPVQSACDPQTGDKLVINGRDVKTGMVVMCKGDPIEYTKKNGQKDTIVCKPIGRLTVLLPIFDRLVSLLLITKGKHDIANIDRQLHLIEGLQATLNRPIAGIELIMSRKLGETHYWQNGQRQTGKDWMISIEVDPDWLKENQYLLRMSRVAGGLLNEIAKPIGIEAPKTAGPEWVNDLGEDDDEVTEGDFSTTTPDPEEIAAFGPPSAPKVEPVKQLTKRKAFKIASVKFDGMTPAQWHDLADAFAVNNPNWQKSGKVDMQHILISAGNSGYADITADNIDEVFAAIVAAHKAEA